MPFIEHPSLEDYEQSDKEARDICCRACKKKPAFHLLNLFLQHTMQLNTVLLMSGGCGTGLQLLAALSLT